MYQSHYNLTNTITLQLLPILAIKHVFFIYKKRHNSEYTINEHNSNKIKTKDLTLYIFQ